VYAVLASNFAKTRTENGEKVNRHRWTGLGLGVVQGLIFFAFFMIPVTGLMNTVEQASNHHSPIANFTTQAGRDAHDSVMMDVYNGIDAVSGAVQGSPVGYITKYTGIQALGSMGTSYFMTVRSGGKSFNIKNDGIRIVHIFKDVVAIEAELTVGETSLDGIMETIKEWPVANFTAVKGTINRIFDISIIRMLLESMEHVANAFKDNDDVKGMLTLFDDDKTNEDFIDSAFSVVSVLTADNIKKDLGNVVDIVRILFGGNFKDGEYKEGLFEPVMDVVNSITGDGDMEVACNELVKALIYPYTSTQAANYDVKKTMAYELTSSIFGFNILQALLGDPKVSNLYKIPLAAFVPSIFEDEEVEFGFNTNTVWTSATGPSVSSEIADLLVGIADCAALVISLIPEDMEDISGIIDAVTGLTEGDVKKIAALLTSLTHSDTVGGIVNIVVTNFAGDFLIDMVSGMTDSLDSVMDSLDTMMDTLRDMKKTLEDTLIDLEEMLAGFGDTVEDLEQVLQEFLDMLTDVPDEYKDALDLLLGDDFSEKLDDLLALIEEGEGALDGIKGMINDVIGTFDTIFDIMDTIIGLVEKVSNLDDFLKTLRDDPKSINWEYELMGIYDVVVLFGGIFEDGFGGFFEGFGFGA